MNVLERIKNGELSIRINTGVGVLRNVYAENELLELAKIGQRMKWISMEEQKPEDWQTVDAYHPDSEERICNVTFHEFPANKQYFHCSDTDKNYWVEEFTHWMPIPNKPI